jgi:ATP-dependent DNA ligase
MEAKSARYLPEGAGQLFEPKWDGFRCLAFRSGQDVLMQSKAGQPLGRYFPELVKALSALPVSKFVIDGEIVVYVGKHLSFDDLLLRIHPAESRIRKLSETTPATLICFDLLVDAGGRSLTDRPLKQRRSQLEALFRRIKNNQRVRLSPASGKKAEAEKWMLKLAPKGLDGVMAKKLEQPYRSGERTGMVKVKPVRTADCVVGGFRYSDKGDGIGSLLLGLYTKEGLLDHVGFSSSFSREERKKLNGIVEPLISPPGFSGRAPGGPSRWNTERSAEWQPLKPKLVCEVQYDHFSGGRFRHGTKFVRWRPDKKPRQCSFEQLIPGRK